MYIEQSTLKVAPNFIWYSFATVFEGSTTSHKVSKLQEQTQYIFRIRAANESGYGAYSEIFTCKTAVQPPAVVKGAFYN